MGLFSIWACFRDELLFEAGFFSRLLLQSIHGGLFSSWAYVPKYLAEIIAPMIKNRTVIQITREREVNNKDKITGTEMTETIHPETR